MHQVPEDAPPGPYVLATGEAAAYRLRLLHGLYGPGTPHLLLEAGLRRGMRVADLGCGVGTVTALLAELVGREGHVVGIDASGAQLDQARLQVNHGGRNASFVPLLLPGLGKSSKSTPTMAFPAPRVVTSGRPLTGCIRTPYVICQPKRQETFPCLPESSIAPPA